MVSPTPRQRRLVRPTGSGRRGACSVRSQVMKSARWAALLSLGPPRPGGAGCPAPRTLQQPREGTHGRQTLCPRRARSPHPHGDGPQQRLQAGAMPPRCSWVSDPRTLRGHGCCCKVLSFGVIGYVAIGNYCTLTLDSRTGFTSDSPGHSYTYCKARPLPPACTWRDNIWIRTDHRFLFYC